MSFLRAGAAALALSFAAAVGTGQSSERMPLTGLAPAKIVPNLCCLRYRVSTGVPECQAFFDQALGYFYSYVWMEAARSFETATQRDPECALAWWGLSRALERWGKREQATKALLRADGLNGKACHREQQLILARMQETGNAPNVGDAEQRKKAAVATVDQMLTLYDDDEEAWYCRAQLAGGAVLFGGQASAVPFYKALLRVNPLHPGANHELVHYYENCRRPGLGWLYAEKYIESSPGIPHPFHMQAHLATRLGRWEKTSDRSAHAIELERAYHKEAGVKPSEDHQFSHHLEVLTLSLVHDGRFREARGVKQEAWDAGFRHWMPWFRLHLAEQDWDEALRVADHFRKSDKTTAAYLSALVFLRQGDAARAAPEVEVLREAYQGKKKDRALELRLWEVQGLLLNQAGNPDGGLKLLSRAVQATTNDYGHHAWGNGAYYMEAWGVAALQAGRYDVAEEAFLEALAHDRGSVRAALGLQTLCERLDRSGEADRYAELARRSWARAEVRYFEAEAAYLRGSEECSTTKAQRETPVPNRASGGPGR
jgi:tetratricopeptide (TPR) repeat protein